MDPTNKHNGSKPPRAWQRMLSGRRLDLLDPQPEDIAIEDIAHGLARVARWNGQTIGDHAFSVAQHSVLVTEITVDLAPNWPPAWRRAALLHDAPEYVIGDLISPFKSVLGYDYKAFEHRLLAAIHKRFNIPVELDADVTQVIKAADRTAAYREATELAGFAPAEAEQYFEAPPTLVSAQLTAWPAAQASRNFLAAFATLSEDLC